MGIFGGFNKKDFDANTQIAINKVVALSRYAKDADMKAKLDCVRMELNKNKFEDDNNAKDSKKIEARMFGCIDNITSYIQRGSEIETYGYCDILLNLINKARQFGKECFSADEINVEEQMMLSKAEMEKMYAILDNLQKQKQELVDKGKTANGVDKQRLIDQFGLCKGQIDTYEANLEEMRKVYNSNSEIVNKRLRGNVYSSIHRVASLKQFQDETRISMKKKLEFDKENAGFDMAFKQFDQMMGVEKSSQNFANEFEAEVATAQKIDAFKSADTTIFKGDTASEFEALINNKND